MYGSIIIRVTIFSKPNQCLSVFSGIMNTGPGHVIIHAHKNIKKHAKGDQLILI
jgi:hypothetical protein